MTRDVMVIGTFGDCLEPAMRSTRAQREPIGPLAEDPVPDQELSGGQMAPKAARTWAGTVWAVGGQPTAADPGPATTAQFPPESWA
jgi:hypothetical protein